MGRSAMLIKQIQERINAIETEAARLMVFANITSDEALGGRLKKSARSIAKNTAAIQRRLATLDKST